jgi:hypothetical protein
MSIGYTEEDLKLVTLARSSRLRAKAREGAALRDTDGRTYTAASVDLPSISMSALKVAIVTAASSGVGGVEAAVVVTEAPALSASDLAVVRDLGGSEVPVYRSDPAGNVLDATIT